MLRGDQVRVRTGSAFSGQTEHSGPEGSEHAALPGPFTASAAKEALGSTRRVVIPLLEHLDARGWTRRIDATQREALR